MQTETIFRIILPALILAFVAHRGYYGNKHKETAESTLKKRQEGLASKIAGLLGLIGLASTLAYIIQPKWMSWASLPLPLWLRWSSLGLAASGFILLQSAQNALGENWSDNPRMIQGQGLITSGIYHYIRHPIYAAVFLILGSTFFLSANWLIGFAWAGMTALEVASRIMFEEALMLEYYGEQYREYMQRTGRLFPKFTVNRGLQ